MADELIRPYNKGKKSFYVNMRFRNGGRPTEKSFCYRYFKWISCSLAVSLYFFNYFILSQGGLELHKPHKSYYLSKTILSESKSGLASRALIESSTDSTSFKLKTKQGSVNNLKVYVYDLPSKYNRDWLINERCKSHLFASEVAIHRAILNSYVKTEDPYEADFFFVPVYVSCNFSTVNGFPAIGHARPLLSSAIQRISSELPFWNRSSGSDHVFVASHDYGACFHAMEEVAVADGIPEFFRNSIILQTFGVKYDHPCQDVENVVIPPYIPPASIRSTLSSSPVSGRRDIFAFFRGKMEVHPKNISGRFYSKQVRTIIWRKYGNDRRFYLKRHRFAGYQLEIARSVFCLCPLGWAPWSPRLVESVALGCVPVLIADGIRLPFASAVPWPEISLTVAERDVTKLGDILEHVAATNLTAIQRNLMEPRVREALMFNDRMVEGDATWQVLHALSEKVGRSHRRSRVSSQLRSDT